MRTTMVFFLFVITACAPAPAAPSTLFPTEMILPSLVPTVKEIASSSPESLTCLHPEDIATWCANLEAKDPHAMWEMAIDAMLDGPANADYWAQTLGKANPTHTEKLNWLKNSTHTDANGDEVGYWLPAKSPDGTVFLWLSANNGQAKYAEFNENKLVQAAGGVSVADMPFVVITPEAFKANTGGIKDWFRTQVLEANKGSIPIWAGTSSKYNPAEVFGLAYVGGKMIFVTGSAYTGEYGSDTGLRIIGSDKANMVAVVTAMLDTYFRAFGQFTKADLNLNGRDAINPDMMIYSLGDRPSGFSTDPADLDEGEILFRETK